MVLPFLGLDRILDRALGLVREAVAQNVQLHTAAAELPSLVGARYPEVNNLTFDTFTGIVNRVDSRIFSRFDLQDGAERDDPRIGRHYSPTHIDAGSGLASQRIGRGAEFLALSQNPKIRLWKRA